MVVRANFEYWKIKRMKYYMFIHISQKENSKVVKKVLENLNRRGSLFWFLLRKKYPTKYDWQIL